MRKICVVLGLFFFIGSFFFVLHGLNDLKIQQKGTIVKMKIIDKPRACVGNKVKYFMKVEYLGKTYSKQIGGNYCETHSVGEIIELVYLNGQENILFPDESINSQIISSILIGLIGLASIIYGIRKRL